MQTSHKIRTNNGLEMRKSVCRYNTFNDKNIVHLKFFYAINEKKAAH